jgi:hypothetical protein
MAKFTTYRYKAVSRKVRKTIMIELANIEHGKVYNVQIQNGKQKGKKNYFIEKPFP